MTAQRGRARSPRPPCATPGPGWAWTSAGDEGEDPRGPRRHPPGSPLLDNRLAQDPGRRQTRDPARARRAGGRGAHRGNKERRRPLRQAPLQAQITLQRLRSTLDRIDRKGYGAYRDLQGTYDLGGFSLSIDRVQRDPFAPPSLIRVRTKENRFDPSLFEGPVRREIGRAHV